MAFESLRAYFPFILIGLSIWALVIFTKVRARKVRNEHAMLKASGRVPGDHQLSNTDLLLVCFNIKKLEDCCSAAPASNTQSVTTGAPSHSAAPASASASAVHSYSKPPDAASWGGPQHNGPGSPTVPASYGNGAAADVTTWTATAQQPYSYGYGPSAPEAAHGQPQYYGYAGQAPDPAYLPAYNAGTQPGSKQPAAMYGQQHYGSTFAEYSGGPPATYSSAEPQYAYSAGAYNGSSPGAEYGHGGGEYGYGRNEYRH